jgi:glucosyl-3-phosphoglycerate synthase
VCFVDADTEGFSAHFVTGLLGPLVCEPEACEVSFVKSFYRRPLAGGEDGGGRVSRLTARPALALFYPELAEVCQPLAGEVAARRELLEALPFVTGYGVEIGMLIDAWQRVGLDGLAQVDLDEHRHAHQPLEALAPMALTVMATIASRLESDELLAPWPERFGVEHGSEWTRLEEADPTPLGRPPLRSLGLARAAG